jgi:hypothetical protein
MRLISRVPVHIRTQHIGSAKRISFLQVLPFDQPMRRGLGTIDAYEPLDVASEILPTKMPLAGT